MSERQAAPTSRQALGHAGEDKAAAYLSECGYTILARNWRGKGGELDLIMRDGEWLVFVEVRSRRGDALGTPEESVTLAKQARLARLGEQYIQSCGWDGIWRIDVVGMYYTADGKLSQITHLIDAIGGLG